MLLYNNTPGWIPTECKGISLFLGTARNGKGELYVMVTRSSCLCCYCNISEELWIFGIYVIVVETSHVV